MRQFFSAGTLALVAGIVSAAAPAFAGNTTVPIPEPSSMGLIASAAAGAAVAYRFIRRK